MSLPRLLAALVCLGALGGCQPLADRHEMANVEAPKLCWNYSGAGNNRIMRLDPISNDGRRMRFSMSQAGFFKSGVLPTSVPLPDSRFEVIGEASVQPGGAVTILPGGLFGNSVNRFEFRQLSGDTIEVRAMGNSINWPTDIICPTGKVNQVAKENNLLGKGG